MRHALLALAACCTLSAADGPIPVTLTPTEGGFQLQRGGAPWRIAGAGGSAAPELFVALGGNTNRTWGVGPETKRILDDAHARGVAMVVGIWLGHERHGFDWSNAQQVAQQRDNALRFVRELKDHPAVLAWGIGNEMEGFQAGDNENIWRGVQELAAAIKAIDPHHPRLTTTAEIGGQRIPLINRLCPDIDIIGINSYGGAPSLPERYRAAGGVKPYMVTEYGPPGTWEIPKNAFGAVEEPTSTAKGAIYRRIHDTLAADPLCVGSMAFTWGAKIEATASWFGILLPDGTRLEAADQLSEAWTGKPVANRCPRIEPLALTGSAVVKPQDRVRIELKTSDPEQDALTVAWTVTHESQNYETGGDAQPEPTPVPEALVSGDLRGAELRMPDGGGIYRVYATVRDGHGGAALASTVIKIDGPILPPKARKLALPAVVYAAGEQPHWFASGMMGDHASIAMDPGCTEQPRAAGGVCLKVTYGRTGGWGGTVWQHPANDWGKAAGGFDLTGAKRLSFWARGAAGGEELKIGVGMIDTTHRWYDTTKAEKSFVLTREWAQYTIDLSDRDLSRIKSGFYWVLAGKPQPVTFYFDEIRFE